MKKTKSVSAVWLVILPNGSRHELPLPFFWYYSTIGLIRVSTKDSNLARVRRGLRAWPDKESGGLRFENTKREPVAVNSIPSNWYSILRLSKCTEPNLYDDMYCFYAKLETQFGGDSLGCN